MLYDRRGVYFSSDGIEEELKRKLEQGGTESNDNIAKVGIVKVYEMISSRVFVKFEKVWEAMGCEVALNEIELCGSIISVARVLENDLPDVLKKKEAKKRDEARAKKKRSCRPKN